MEQLQYLKYNNYFNHTHKPSYRTPIDYWNATNTPAAERVLLKQNFVPGDGVNTTHTLGKGDGVDEYDYLVVYSDTIIPTVISRWFIIKSDRLRGGQWNLTLKRDTISDFYDNLLNAPAIIERAMVNSDNPLIFNKEQFTYNQIKKDELLLQDETKCPWIVAYIPTDAAGKSNVSLKYGIDNYTQVDELPFKTGEYKKIKSTKYDVRWQNGVNGPAYKSTVLQGGYPSSDIQSLTGLMALRTTSPGDISQITFNIASAFNSYPMSAFNRGAQEYLNAVDPSILSEAKYQELQSYVGKTVYDDETSAYYQIQITERGNTTGFKGLTDDTQSFYSTASNILEGSGIFDSNYDTIDAQSMTINYSAQVLSVVWNRIQPTNDIKLSVAAQRKKNDSGLYDIICMPYGDINIYENGLVVCSTNSFVQRAAAITLGLEYSGAIYDLQLLPYCPVRGLLNNGNLDITGRTVGTDYDYLKDGSNNAKGILFYVTETNTTFNIYKAVDKYGNEQVLSDILKVDQPEVYNVKSPDYSTDSINENEPYVLWNKGSDTIDTGAWGTYLEFNDNFGINAAADSIKVEKIDLNSNQVIKTFYTDTVGFDMEYLDATHIKIENIDLFEEYVSMTDYNNASYRYVITFTSPVDYYAEEETALGYIPLLMQEILPKATYITENSAVATKVDSECSFERLSSPNYQGQFEFCVAKNNGVDFINVDMTLKPINPYIHLNPNFKNMYGDDWNDARGLICNGDFSFGLKEDKFQTYELQNRNYENIFNRQIQNMDVEHKLQKGEAIAGMVAGALQGGATGFGMGMMSGNPIAAGALAGVGTAASLGAGVADLSILNKRQAEQKDLAIDMHEFQLGNIRALPYSLTKCPAFTYNNKLFPFIERYSATDEEIKILKNYLSLRSFNVNAMGSIREYIQDQPTFIKGQLIRLDELHCPTNIANDLYNEINQGVYI